MLDYVISWTCEVCHDILTLQSISCKTVSKNISITSLSWWTLVFLLCLNIIFKMSVLCFVFIIAINNNGVSNAF